ncbi:futalosine hydrolase [Desulfuromonas versatilis]|uniref:Futalosine hydrolase n=1 Tax=Desulfuromonas versatilis TaxID=2802975 RepID=A0ABM9SDD1_9BACT|nr:futalosine hydrolase [Desulfuromonas versatilis]BCR03057.1 futalosine hydrolase [Desulfuromonas versatilis]
MLALIAAVPMETELLRQQLFPCEVRECGRRELLQGRLSGRPVALLHSGVGKAGAAAATQALLEKLRPAAVINFGCGGAYPGSGLRVGDLALANEEVFGDEGVIAPAGFLDMEQLGFPLLEKGGRRLFNRFPVDGQLLGSARRLLADFALAQGCKMAVGPLVTVSSCSGLERLGWELAERTGGICENMEGAAVAQQCALYDTPLVALRGISNLVEDRDMKRWDLKLAARNAQLAVQTLLAHWPLVKETA